MNNTRKLILASAFLVSTVTMAQKSFFENVSEENKYDGYSQISEAKKGFFKAKTKTGIFKFKKEYLPTGEGYKLTAIVNEGSKQEKTYFTTDASEKRNGCEGYPYESRLTKDYGDLSYVSIDDYIFLINGISKDNTTFKNIYQVYIKAKNSKGKSKKKNSFLSKLKAIKDAAKASKGMFGAEYNEFKKKNIRKIITDYLVAMKTKQNARTAKQKRSDKNILKFKQNKIAAKKAAKDAEWAEAKRYNDSVKATPKWQDLQRRKAQNERNYQGAKRRNKVTLRNNSSRTIYVGRSGSRNPGTKINAGSSALWSCSQSAYLQVITKSGGSNAYSSTNRKVYSANAGCGKTINVN